MRQSSERQLATVRAVRPLSDSVREIELVPDSGPLPWTVGSHLQVQVPIEGHHDWRSYSLVGLPDRTAYRIAVKRVDASRGGSRAMWQLESGHRVTLIAPANHFELSYAAPQSLLVAGGIGITPLLGMALALAARGHHVSMAYAARTRDALVYEPELRSALGVRLHTFVSDDGQRLAFEPLLRDLHAQAQMLVCGPLPLLHAAQQAWAAAGRPLSLLRFETFGASGEQPAQSFWVRLPRHGLEIVVPPGCSLLDALESHGVPLLADCRRGECGLCALDVLQVEGALDHRDVFFTDDQKRSGRRMCTCVSRVVGGGVVLDTDWRDDAPGAAA
jgi:vanillate O-demethylase ferredoxin subunit